MTNTTVSTNHLAGAASDHLPILVSATCKIAEPGDEDRQEVQWWQEEARELFDVSLFSIPPRTDPLCLLKPQESGILDSQFSESAKIQLELSLDRSLRASQPLCTRLLRVCVRVCANSACNI